MRRAAVEVCLEGLDDQPFHIGVADRARRPRPRFVIEPIKAPISEPAPPLRHRRLTTAQPSRDLGHWSDHPPRPTTIRHRDANA